MPDVTRGLTWASVLVVVLDLAEGLELVTVAGGPAVRFLLTLAGGGSASSSTLSPSSSVAALRFFPRPWPVVGAGTGGEGAELEADAEPVASDPRAAAVALRLAAGMVMAREKRATVEGREMMMDEPQDGHEVDRGAILISKGGGDGDPGTGLGASCCSKSKSLLGDNPSCNDISADDAGLKASMPGPGRV